MTLKGDLERKSLFYKGIFGNAAILVVRQVEIFSGNDLMFSFCMHL